MPTALRVDPSVRRVTAYMGLSPRLRAVVDLLRTRGHAMWTDEIAAEIKAIGRDVTPPWIYPVTTEDMTYLSRLGLVIGTTQGWLRTYTPAEVLAWGLSGKPDKWPQVPSVLEVPPIVERQHRRDFVRGGA